MSFFLGRSHALGIGCGVTGAIVGFLVRYGRTEGWTTGIEDFKYREYGTIDHNKRAWSLFTDPKFEK